MDKTQFNSKKTSEKITVLLNYAVMAPSTHNTQPWLFEILDNSVKIYANNDLDLRYADPTGRDKYISLGCALENLIIASNFYGVETNIDYVLSNELVAEISFKFNTHSFNEKEPGLLIKAIENWINSRGVFKEDSIDIDTVKKIKDESLNIVQTDENIAVHLLYEKEKLVELASLTKEGVEKAHKNAAFRKEMSKWMHNSLSKRKEGIPGYALNMPFFLSFVIPSLIKYVNMGPKLAQKSYLGISTAKCGILITSRGSNDKKTWLSVGRLAQRIMLNLQVIKYNTSIYVASIEVPGLDSRLIERLNLKGEVPHFFFVTGKMDAAHPKTPRHSVEDKIITK